MEISSNVYAGSPLTKNQEDLLLQIASKKAESVPVSEFPDRIDDIRQLIARGLLRMRIVAFPWGVEFELEHPQ